MLFSDQKIVKDFLYDSSFFYKMAQKELRPDEVKQIGARYWSFYESFPETDIIWQHLHRDSLFSYVKTTILWVLLLLFSIVLLTPLLLINMSQDVIDNT